MPTTLFTITRTEHTDCARCEALANDAATMARVTGSRKSAYSRETHGARVERVTKEK
jgi:hypothetical protein